MLTMATPRPSPLTPWSAPNHHVAAVNAMSTTHAPTMYLVCPVAVDVGVDSAVAVTVVMLFSSHQVEDGEDPQPEQIHHVPVGGAVLDEARLLGCGYAHDLSGAAVHEPQQGHGDQDMRQVDAGDDEVELV